MYSFLFRAILLIDIALLYFVLSLHLFLQTAHFVLHIEVKIKVE